MIKKLSYETYAGKVAELMPQNAFMTTSAGGKQNTMTIGWGTVGVIWRKNIFVALVRQSRFTKELVDKSEEFTVTFPASAAKEIQNALNFCGTKSGRDFDDKIAAASLGVKSGQVIQTPVLDIAGLHLECKVVYKQTMAPAELCPKIQDSAYGSGDYHTMYFGEIVEAYETE